MGFLAEKRILITGLLSKHSIAYGIAKACHREGAKLAFTYQTERFKDRAAKFAAEYSPRNTVKPARLGTVDSVNTARFQPCRSG